MMTSQAYRALFLAIGCALFVYLVIRLGPAEILSLLLGIGWRFGLIVAAYAGHQMIRAVALRQCITTDHRASYWDLVRIRLSGEAVRFLTFTGPFLAEPAKALLLRKRGSTTTQAFAATTSEYLVYTFTSAAMAVAGLGYLLYGFELSRPVAVAARIVMYAAGAFLFAAAYAITRRVYLIGAVVKGIGRLPAVGRYLRIDQAKLRDTEDLLFAVLRAQPSRLLSIVAIELVAQALLVLELFVLLGTTGQPFFATDPFVIESASKFVGLAFFFIPGQIGAAEGTYAVIFEAIGLTASAGFSLALARRLRTLMVAGAGFMYLVHERGRTSDDVSRD
jgi:Lysylphosphatidylglycerol synthase TM region